MYYPTADAAIAAARAEAEGQGFIEFDGQNCNDYLEEDQEECAGWDGEDYRCECGNRRVYWNTGGDDVMGYYAFACAN